MNIDRDIVARAFSKAGEEPITQEEWTEGNGNRVRVVKDFYLAILLDSLASYDWTSQKKRVRLEAYTEEDEENLTGFAYMYPIPADCAKIVKVGDNAVYIVEGAFIFSDEPDAILLYIKDYFTGQYEYSRVENPVAEDVSKYYYIDSDGDYVKENIFDNTRTYYVIVENDYNFYDQPVLDPTLSSYFECRIAAAIALKLTGDTAKYQMLYNEAQLIANNAMKKSAEQSQNKTQGNKWWTSQLGLD